MIGEPGEAVAVPSRAGSAAGAPASPPREESDFRAVINGAREKATGRAKASPLARRMAREGGIELGDLTGTGPEGRIVAEDVERAVAGAAAAPAPAASPEPAPGEVESIPLTSIRKTIARRLTAAWQVPAFQLTVSAEMTHANALVERSRELNPDVRVTVTDLLAKVCARALMLHPEVNARSARRRSCSSRPRTSASPSPPRRGSSFR